MKLHKTGVVLMTLFLASLARTGRCQPPVTTPVHQAPNLDTAGMGECPSDPHQASSIGLSGMAASQLRDLLLRDDMNQVSLYAIHAVADNGLASGQSDPVLVRLLARPPEAGFLSYSGDLLGGR